ncbi:MAG: D-alanyl-D-alanine carboxypeptidase family protein [Monoglobales bacterium]
MKKFIAFIILTSLILCYIPAQVFAFDANEITCNAALLMEADTGTVLFNKNGDEKVAIASITKLMVLLIAFEEIKAGNLSMDTVITGTQEGKEVGGSTMFLDAGEKFPLETIIKAICIASANDATVSLSQHIAGSTEAFVTRMNKRAEELGLKKTHFKNVVGFDDFEHYSTAYDVAVLCRELITKHPEILRYSAIKEEWIRECKTQLLNTNRLLSRYEFATGLKTGTETSAKYCLAATSEKDGTKFIAIILGAEDNESRFKQAEILLKHGYNDFDLTVAAAANESYGEVKVLKGKLDTVLAFPAYDVKVIVPKGEAGNIKHEVVLSKSVSAPVAKGTEIGQITIRVDGEIAATAPLVAGTDVERVTFFGAILKLFKAMFAF